MGSRAGLIERQYRVDEASRWVEAEGASMTEQVEAFSRFVGVDWGSETHQACVIDGSRKILLEKAFAHSGKGLSELVAAVLAAAGVEAEQVAVAIEVPRGAIVDTLLERGLAVFAINPKQLDRFRDRHSVAGAKDDRRDALVLADSLRTDEPAFRRVRAGDPTLIELRELSRIHEELKAERIALGNRLREQMQRYFPQVLTIGNVYEDRWLWELLEKTPTPELAKRVSLAKIGSLLKRHRIRSITPEAVREAVSAESLHIAPGVLEACQRHVALLLPRLRLVHDQKNEVEREIEALLEKLSEPLEGKAEHRDARLLQSLPGLGKLVCATMLTEATEPLENRDYRSLRTLCGVAPVTKRSGKQHAVSMRMSCSRRLRTALFYWADNATKREAHWKERYAALRAGGHSHGRALRGLADRLLALLVAVLKSGTPYDPARRGRATLRTELIPSPP
jgi:transposase